MNELNGQSFPPFTDFLNSSTRIAPFSLVTKTVAFHPILQVSSASLALGLSTSHKSLNPHTHYGGKCEKFFPQKKQIIGRSLPIIRDEHKMGRGSVLYYDWVPLCTIHNFKISS
jgi:hypothetical protein